MGQMVVPGVTSCLGSPKLNYLVADARMACGPHTVPSAGRGQSCDIRRQITGPLLINVDIRVDEQIDRRTTRKPSPRLAVVQRGRAASHFHLLGDQSDIHRRLGHNHRLLLRRTQDDAVVVLPAAPRYSGSPG